MPTTRHQNPETYRFRQDAFSSSPEYDQGLRANLVAARCAKLPVSGDMAVYWWLQQVSWREGSLEKFAEEFLAANLAAIYTPSMRKFGMAPGQVYNAAQVRAVRHEMRGGARLFPLRGELCVREGLDSFLSETPAQELQRENESRSFPVSYLASEMVKACIPSADEFARALREALVNPGAKPLREGLWYFSGLWEALLEARQKEINAARGRVLETAVSREVFATLDYAHDSKSFVLIEGREGIGKSVAVRSWCAQHPGEAIYVQLSSGSDETTLLRSIAREVGTACGLALNVAEMKARVEAALMPGQVTLVLDEAHFLWPLSQRAQRSAPRRLDWLRTALIDHGVPVVLISTPQHFKRQCERFRGGGWNANQIQRRLEHAVSLPEALPLEDTLAVAERYFPEASEVERRQIAVLAMLTVGYLTTISSIRKRVTYLAKQTPDMPRREVLARAMAEVCKREGIKPDAIKVPDAGSVHKACSDRAAPAHTRAQDTSPASRRQISPTSVATPHNREVALREV